MFLLFLFWLSAIYNVAILSVHVHKVEDNDLQWIVGMLSPVFDFLLYFAKKQFAVL